MGVKSHQELNRYIVRAAPARRGPPPARPHSGVSLLGSEGGECGYFRAEAVEWSHWRVIQPPRGEA